MAEKDPQRSDDTLLVHDERHSKGAVAPPIYQTSLFTFESYQAMVDRFSGASAQPIYSRVDNPTVSVLLEKMCQIEGGERALAFSSGIAAISNAILGQVKSGDRIVCVKHVYPDTYRLLKFISARFGVNTDFVDGTDLAAIEKSLPGAKLLYLESPTTWVMEEQDLRSIATMAKAEAVTTIVDNSWATPIFQKPLRAGIDLVVHSASKYISGHSDTVAGAARGQAVDYRQPGSGDHAVSWREAFSTGSGVAVTRFTYIAYSFAAAPGKRVDHRDKACRASLRNPRQSSRPDPQRLFITARVRRPL